MARIGSLVTTFLRFLNHYPSHIWLFALVGRLDVMFWVYASINLLYLGRGWLGSSSVSAAPARDLRAGPEEPAENWPPFGASRTEDGCFRALWGIAAFWMVLLVAPRSGAEVPSIDERLQASAERWLRTAAPHEGAVVMSDVKTGRVLAWASLGGGDRVGAAFAPLASVFKLATVSALLDSGAPPADSTVCYSGGERSIDLSDLRDVHVPGEACIPLRTAVGHSINVAIAKLALRHTQPAEVQAKARFLGLDGVVPIDRAVGRSHITIPDDPLGFARAAAGFWSGRTSALGALFAVQTIANGGTRVRSRRPRRVPRVSRRGARCARSPPRSSHA